MPSPKPSSFESTEQLIAPRNKVVRQDHADYRRAAAHPARRRGRLTDEERAEAVEATMAMMDTKTPAEIAISLGMGSEARPVREIIKAARSALQSRAEAYVNLHLQAAVVAAAQGDAKPAQWALERIAEQGDRVLDPPQEEAKTTAPSFQIGFILGGVPAGAIPHVEPVALPPAAIDATPATPEPTE